MNSVKTNANAFENNFSEIVCHHVCRRDSLVMFTYFSRIGYNLEEFMYTYTKLGDTYRILIFALA